MTNEPKSDPILAVLEAAGREAWTWNMERDGSPSVTQYGNRKPDGWADVKPVLDSDGIWGNNPNVAAAIVRAVNTFAGAREALRLAQAFLREQSEVAGDVSEWNEGGIGYETAHAVRAALAAMEGKP